MCKIFFNTVMLWAVSFAIHADPVYLYCTVKGEDNKPSSYYVSLNEITGKVSFTVKKTGYTVFVNGVFTPNEISFQDIDRDDIVMAREFVINRSSLEMVHIFSIWIADPEMAKEIYKDTGKPKPAISTGSCNIVNVNDRKI